MHRCKSQHEYYSLQVVAQRVHLQRSRVCSQARNSQWSGISRPCANNSHVTMSLQGRPCFSRTAVLLLCNRDILHTTTHCIILKMTLFSITHAYYKRVVPHCVSVCRKHLPFPRRSKSKTPFEAPDQSLK